MTQTKENKPNRERRRGNDNGCESRLAKQPHVSQGFRSPALSELPGGGAGMGGATSGAARGWGAAGGAAGSAAGSSGVETPAVLSPPGVAVSGLGLARVTRPPLCLLHPLNHPLSSFTRECTRASTERHDPYPTSEKRIIIHFACACESAGKCGTRFAL